MDRRWDQALLRQLGFAIHKGVPSFPKGVVIPGILAETIANALRNLILNCSE
jgi:hypothetical protein